MVHMHWPSMIWVFLPTTPFVALVRPSCAGSLTGPLPSSNRLAARCSSCPAKLVVGDWIARCGRVPCLFSNTSVTVAAT
jgi:hypothetical protein